MTPRSTRLSPTWTVGLPLGLTLVLLGLGLLESVGQNPRLWWSFVGAGIALLTWIAVLFGSALRTGRTLTLDIVLRKQHYVQACAARLGAALLGLVLG